MSCWFDQLISIFEFEILFLRELLGFMNRTRAGFIDRASHLNSDASNSRFPITTLTRSPFMFKCASNLTLVNPNCCRLKETPLWSKSVMKEIEVHYFNELLHSQMTQWHSIHSPALTTWKRRAEGKKWNKFPREIAKFQTMFSHWLSHILLALTCCSHFLSLLLTPNCLLFYYYFVFLFCFTWHWKCLSLLLRNFYYLLWIVEFFLFCLHVLNSIG